MGICKPISPSRGGNTVMPGWTHENPPGAVQRCQPATWSSDWSVGVSVTWQETALGEQAVVSKTNYIL